MEVIINNEKRYFDDLRIRLWDKVYPIIKIWYILFPILYIMYLLEFVNDLEDISIFIPFFQCFIVFVLCFPLQILLPNGNKKYIISYYPDIAKKLYPFGYSGYNTLTFIKFINYEYIDYEADEIIDTIIEYSEQIQSFLKMVFFGGALFLDILGIISVQNKTSYHTNSRLSCIVGGFGF